MNNLYYIIFYLASLCSPAAPPNSAACIWKNNVFVVCLWVVKGYFGYDNGSNAVVLPMGPGDSVNVMLEPNRTVNDSQSHLKGTYYTTRYHQKLHIFKTCKACNG